ncbi:creatininase family protein [Pseudohaliea rubra]|uniref:Creatinine amidohydrolase n=1 Tax=Pseudohaliea rubra DSM 19751 TaxID=1265313 RepID=A0A095VVE3_9GAMM|nr:creatininase family protein [Pseudohaliea rubra]KGE05008.1 Creatinine amidohydrolase [Pseudohaliea rubra DSM 19751]
MKYSRYAFQSRAALCGVLALLALATPPPAQGGDDGDDALTAPRPIAGGDSPWLEELTWMEIRDRIAAGTDTVIIPTGGIEENGPYLATGKHNLILEATCPAIAAALDNALCAPIVKFVPEGRIEPPEGAMRYPGTISLTPATYEALLTDIARSLKQAGFRHVVLIGDSGGNQAGMAAVAERLGNAWAGSGTAIHFVREYYDPGWSATEDYTRNTLGVRETRHDGYHDDIWVTAMMMVTDPTQVRYTQRVEAGLASINGVPLEPLAPTVALGRAMIDFRARYTADAIRKTIATHD